MTPCFRWAPALTAALAALSVSAEKIDLSRVTPVAADVPIPIVDFVRPPLLEDPVINPGGTRLAAIASAAEDCQSVMVYDTGTSKTEIMSVFADRDASNPVWLDNDRLLFRISRDDVSGLGLYGLDTKRGLHAYPVLQFCAAYVIAVPDTNRLRPVVWIRDDLESGRDWGVGAINAALDDGRFIDLPKNTAERTDYTTVRDENDRHIVRQFPVIADELVSRYLCDNEGLLEFAITTRDGRSNLHRLEGNKWIQCPVDLDDIDVLAVGNRRGELIVQGHRGDGKPRPVQIMEAASGKLGEVLLEDAGYDFDGWFYRDPKTHEVIGANCERNGPHVVWFRPQERAIQKLLAASFDPGEVVQIVSRSLLGNKFVIRRFTDRQPPIYDFVDLDAHKAGIISNSRPWIDPARMQPRQILRFKTRDGRRLDAYLTLPAGASQKHPAPMIVLPHGGPYLREAWGFNVEAEWLASRGYAVLQPNYRGSTGYDWMFPDDDRWDLVKMHNDVTDAAKAMIASKLVDPDRVAIMGGSFGGYLSVCGVANEPQLYRCAVTIDGIFDWEAMLSQERYPPYESGQYGWLKRRLGDPKLHRERFEAISPIRRADRIRAPVFVAHGKDDLVVDRAQSRDLVSALQRNHVPVDTMFIGGEDRGIARLDQRVELYTRIESFLAKYLAPRSKDVAAQ